MKHSSVGAGLAALLALASCGNGGEGVADVLLVRTVEVTPPEGDLVLGGTVQLVATPRTAGGLAVPGRAVSWSSSNAAVVSVSPSGVGTALALGGPIRIRATVDGVDGEALITVRPFPVARVTISPDQSGILVGGSTQLVATALDASGDPLPGRFMVWQSSAPAIAAVTSTGIVLGMAEGGPVTITATSEGKLGTAAVTVAPRPATHLGFVQEPSAATAGKPISPAVRVVIRNDQGGTVTSATTAVTVSLSTNPGGSTLSGTTTVAAVGGTATFSDLTLDKAGAGYTLTATGAGLTSATSTTFSNVAGPASQLVFTAPPPSSALSGLPLSPQPALQLRDDFGNAVGQAGVVVTASVSGGTATLAGGTTATTNAAGAASFSNLSLTGASGSIVLTFSAPGLTSSVSGPITLTSGAAASLGMVTQPSSTAQTGTPFAVQPVVELRDASGNHVNTAGVSITATLASGPAGGALGGGTVTQTAGTGRAAFTGLGITGPLGSYTIQFSASGLTGVTSAAIILTAGPPSQLTISSQPSSSAPSGSAIPQQPVLQLRDASGNVAAASGVAVTASISSGGGTLGGTATVTTNASGVAAFTSLSITGLPGDRTLGFSSPGLTGATSTPITVTATIPSPASQLAITTQPSSAAVSGTALGTQPAVQLRNSQGSVVSVGGVAVTASIASGGGTLGGTTNIVTDASGRAAFTDLSITGPSGNRTLAFSSQGLVGATSTPISVTGPAGPASQLALTTQPSSSAASGTTLGTQPAVQLRDAQGLAVSQSGVPVTVSVASGSAALSGNLTVNTNSTGRATFSGLTLTGPIGAHTLRFSSPGLPAAVSGTINLAAGTAAQLVIMTGPASTAQSGKPFSVQPVVLVQDGSGNPVLKSGISVTAAINSGVGTLRGHRSKNTDGQGVATFDDLEITGLGLFTIRFTASGLTPAVSGTITVTP